jgi:hypothetical protein
MSGIRGTLSPDELIRIVKMAGESDEIDAKGPIAWDNGVESAGLTKDIAAFANSRNGGIIVIGKKQEKTGQFDTTGVTQEQAVTFETTKVAQWVNNHLSPPVRLVCYPAVECDGKRFVVIEVLEFDDVPVMCVKSFQRPNSSENLLKEQTIYVRNANAASAPLGLKELPSLIGLATKKKGDELLAMFHAMLQGRSLVPPPTDEERFQEELAVIEPALRPLDKRNGCGDWFFAFHPVIYNSERWPERDYLEQAVRQHAFRIVQEFPPCYKGTQGREWGIANELYSEHWALTRSGLFVVHRPFREDDIDSITAHLSCPTYETHELKLGPGQWLELGWSLRAICEAFVFMSRMAEVYDPGETIVYQLGAGPLGERRLVAYRAEMSLWEIANLYGPPDPCRASMFSRRGSLDVAEVRADWKTPCMAAMKDFIELFPSHGIDRNDLSKWVDGFLKRDSRTRW